MARKLPMIEVGFHIFPQGGDEEVGAVREVAPGGRPELVVDIENAGDFVIPLDAVVEVVEEKVIVDPKKLPDRVQQKGVSPGPASTTSTPSSTYASRSSDSHRSPRRSLWNLTAQLSPS